MHVYLVQHAEALSSEQNPLRPLSKKGSGDARRMGEYLGRQLRLVIPEVLHSGRERAAQTAELLARGLKASCNATSDLKPSDDPSLWARQLSLRTRDIMLVGHLPHLQRLAGLLLCNDDAVSILHFRNGGVICLQREAGGGWSIEWALTPALLGSEA